MAKQKGKKKWFLITAPKEFKGIILGETLAYEGNELIGRNLVVSLMNLTGDPKKQNMEISLKITGVDGTTARTESFGYALMKSYLKRLSRKESRKIDESYKLELKNKDKVVIKPVLITKGKTPNSVISVLRKKTFDFLKDYFSKTDFNHALISITNNQVQRDLQNNLKKTYPVVVCQFRIFKKI